MYDIQYLIKNSNLPGPRGNLQLLYDFSKNAPEELIEECLTYVKPKLKNTPEEFIAMCGILAFAVKNKDDLKEVIPFLRIHANHNSWRVRESVAMSLQEVSERNLEKILPEIECFVHGTQLEQRAVVAGLCEPKLLEDRTINLSILEILLEISRSFTHGNKLDENSSALRKSLGYGWSVVISKEPEAGKVFFEKMLGWNGNHIKWIIKENLKKKRLVRMDSHWVESCLSKIM